MVWIQKEITLGAKSRGFSLITEEIMRNLPELKQIKMGIMHIFIQHTSASLTINENADPSARRDLESFFNRMIPDNTTWFSHNTEGSDDMPAHIKSSVLGSNLTLPVTDGAPNLGTWQGIYLCEHRNNGGRRSIVVTVFGEV